MTDYEIVKLIMEECDKCIPNDIATDELTQSVIFGLIREAVKDRSVDDIRSLIVRTFILIRDIFESYVYIKHEGEGHI